MYIYIHSRQKGLNPTIQPLGIACPESKGRVAGASQRGTFVLVLHIGFSLRKPFILGYLHVWKPPYKYIYIYIDMHSHNHPEPLRHLDLGRALLRPAHGAGRATALRRSRSRGPWQRLVHRGATEAVMGGSIQYGVSMGVPPKWLVYFMENPPLKWMMTGFTSV